MFQLNLQMSILLHWHSIEMNALQLSSLAFLISSIKSASIPRNDTLEVFKKDVAEVGNAIENFTFDILRDIIQDPEDEETATVENVRKKRATDEMSEMQLCQKRCEQAHRIETQQIKDLKIEVKKLQEMVKLLQDQQKIINVLDKEKQTSAEQPRSQTGTEETENAPNAEELARMKVDLKEVIKDLNHTRELINLQKARDEALVHELKKQKDEISELRRIVSSILPKNSTDKETVEEEESGKARSSGSASSKDLSGIRKLLKSLPEDDDEDEELRSKLADLQKHLNKKRRQESLVKELKNLEKSLNEESSTGDNNNSNDLLRQIIEALKKTEPKDRSDDVDITGLSDLEEAINKLRPKEDESAQFQAMLNKLVNKPTNQRPSQITITPQQMNELTKKLTPNNYPPICIVDDGGVKSNGYRAPTNSRNFQFAPPIDYSRGQQFFPGQFTPPNYYAQGNVNGASPEKPLPYQGENGDYNQKYQEDLRQQIGGLQAAIDNLNRPEYVQRPEDKVIIDDLQQQIGDLRSVVENQNDGNYQGRTKRSLENNEVEEAKEVERLRSVVGQILETDDSPKTQLANIQSQIDSIKNQMDGGNSNLQASTPYVNPLPQQSYSIGDLTNPQVQDLTRSFKGDFLADVISKILEKVIKALPAILQKVFGFTLDELSKYDPQDYDVQTIYKNLGIFAYLPVILLRLIKGVSTFINILRKNAFFKNFLVPTVILGLVAGSVVFLIWWLQPDDVTTPYNYITDTSDQNYYNQNYYNQYNQQPASYNYPVYNRSYFNK